MTIPSAVAASAATASVYPDGLRNVLLVLLLLASSVWIGGWFIAIVVARTATATLSGADRVAFFRMFGRRYGITTTVALVIGFGAGLVLLVGMPWTVLSSVLVIVGVVLAVVLWLGVLQARAQTRRRQASAKHPDDQTLAARIARSAAWATWLRAAIGLISIAMLVLAVIRMA